MWPVDLFVCFSDKRFSALGFGARIPPNYEVNICLSFHKQYLSNFSHMRLFEALQCTSSRCLQTPFISHLRLESILEFLVFKYHSKTTVFQSHGCKNSWLWKWTNTFINCKKSPQEDVCKYSCRKHTYTHTHVQATHKTTMFRVRLQTLDPDRRVFVTVHINEDQPFAVAPKRFNLSPVCRFLMTLP